MLLAAILAFNRIGSDVIDAAFFSEEALSRNIWRPIMLIATAVMVLIGLLEWRIRMFILNRRVRDARTA
jgi:hypothetical protein